MTAPSAILQDLLNLISSGNIPQLSANSLTAAQVDALKALSYSPSAPSVKVVDYLHGVRCFAASADYLVSANFATPSKLSVLSRDGLYSETVVGMFPTATFPNSPAADGVSLITSSIQSVVIQDVGTMWVEVGAATANNVLYKVVSGDRFATARYEASLYLGADDPNTGIGGNARGMVNYRLLSQHGMDIDTNGDVYLTEYIGATQANGQRIRLLKLPANSKTWIVLWSLNVGASEHQARHFHCCKLHPRTKALWVAAGDQDRYDSALPTTADDTWFFAWDKTGFLPDSSVYNTPISMVAALKATPTLKILSGEQKHRVVQFLFMSDGVYFQSDASPTGLLSWEESGIYRVDDACTKMDRVFAHPAEEQQVSGYYSVATDQGTMVFLPACTDTADYVTGYVPVITGNKNGDFAIAGRIGVIQDSSPIPYGVCFDPVLKLVLVNYSSMSGKGAAVSQYQTIVFRVTEGVPHNRVTYSGNLFVMDPEILHPVYWVDPGNITSVAADSGTGGYSPRNPCLTPPYMLSSSRSTHGGSLKFLGSSYTATSSISTANWSANAQGGDSSLPMEIDLRGIKFLLAFSGAWISYSVTQHVKIRGDIIWYNGDAAAGTVAGVSAAMVQTTSATADCAVTLYSSRLGYLGREAGVSGGRLAFMGRGKLSVKSSRVMLASAAEIMQNINTATGPTTLEILDSVIDETKKLATDTRTDTVYVVKNSIFQVRNQFISYTNASASTGIHQFDASVCLTCSTTAGQLAFVGTGKPASFAVDPFRNCVVNFNWTSSIDGITISSPEFWVSNTKTLQGVVGTSYIITAYKPTNPGKGDWRDPRFPGIGPRISLLPDVWSEGYGLT